MADRVLITRRAGVAEVRLSRPDKLNALDPDMFEAIAAAGHDLGRDPMVRAIVLSGEGNGFCAGLDMERMEALARGESILPFADLTQRTHGVANYAQHIVWLWRELPVPVIAAVHGVAIGGGFQLALGADIRVVSPDARLALVESKWGLVPDMAGMHLMSKLARDDIAAELVFTGRSFSGTEAFALGLATKLADEPRGAAVAMAEEIASRSPDAIRAVKRLLRERVLAGAMECLSAETEEQRKLIGTANQIEAVTAHFERRMPCFVPAIASE